MDIYTKKPGTAIKLTKEIINEQLLPRGIIMLDEYTGSLKMNTFQCDKGHSWITSPNSVRGGTGCQICHREGRKLTNNEFSEWLVDHDRGISIIGKYETAHIKTLFECKCGHQWSSTPNNIKRGQGCPQCAKSGFKKELPAWVYIIKFANFIKYGITNDLSRRLGTHRKNGTYELVFSAHLPRGIDAILWESDIKRTHGGRFVTKEQCPDGYTETLPLEKLSVLLLNYTLPGVSAGSSLITIP